MRNAMMGVGLAGAFVAGLFASKVMPDARAQSAPPPAAPPAQTFTPRIINLTTELKDEDIGPLVPMTELRTRTLGGTEFGTIGVQSGNIFKHFHADAHEVQYIIEGRGTFWLGDKQVDIKPGDLIFIPKGTVHAGSKTSDGGRFRAIAFKMPPQRPDDTKRVD